MNVVHTVVLANKTEIKFQDCLIESKKDMIVFQNLCSDYLKLLSE